MLTEAFKTHNWKLKNFQLEKYSRLTRKKIFPNWKHFHFQLGKLWGITTTKTACDVTNYFPNLQTCIGEGSEATAAVARQYSEQDGEAEG